MSQPTPPRRPSNPMGQKPRVPVGPRRTASVTSASPPPRTRSRGARVVRLVLYALGAIVLLGALAGAGIAGIVMHYSRGLPDVHHLRAQFRPPQTTRVIARDGTTVLAEWFVERRTVVPLTAMSPNLIRAVLAAEDAYFFDHGAVSYLGLARAVVVNLRHGSAVQGASTITQQVVKNVLLSPERTFARKMREVLLAEQIERELTKQEILELYLNYIAFGHGRNGVEEASLYYFGKHANQLTLGECALIAGLPKSPTRYSPRNNPDEALRRRRWVLGQMVHYNMATQAEADAAAAEPIHLADTRDDVQGIAPEVREAAREVLEHTVGEEALRAGGFQIFTTIDPGLERAAREALQAGLRDLDARQGYTGPLLAPGERRLHGRPGYVLPGEAPPASGRLLPGHIYGGVVDGATDPDPAGHTPGAIAVRVGDVTGRVPWDTVARYVRDDAAPSAWAPRGAIVRVSVDRAGGASDGPLPMRLELGPQGAVVAIDPQTREVRALVGGYDALAGMFDRATLAHRQAGSSFKPFLYSLALASRRFTLASTVDPNPACFDRWCPHEAHGHAHPGDPPEAPMRIREALAQSRNMVAARVVMQLGPQALADQAGRIGITSTLSATPSLALGTADVTPLEMTDAYATWDAAGRWAPPVLITRIVGPDGHEVALPAAAPARQALTPDVAYLVTSMMESVVDHGTGVRARVLHRPVSGKTGTSNEARDAWFMGFTPDMVAGVWVGFDDRQPLGHAEEGARSALPVWLRFMQTYLSSTHPAPPPVEFAAPAGVVTVHIDPLTGLLARPDQTDGIDEVFLAGTEPHEIATLVTDAGTNFFTTALSSGDGGGIAINEATDETAAVDAGATDASDASAPPP